MNTRPKGGERSKINPYQKIEWIKETRGDELRKSVVEIGRILNSKRGLDFKAAELAHALDKHTALFSSVSPCRAGCAFCCYQSVVIFAWEAKRIAAYSKRKLAKFKGVNLHGAQTARQQYITKYNGKICPFLVDNKCSVYPVRPFACRLHVSLDSDAKSCDTINNPGAEVPYLNITEIMLEIAKLFDTHKQNSGDIRDFFGEA